MADPANGRRLAAIAALFAVPMMALTLGLFIGGDLGVIFDPAQALAMSPDKIAMFQLSMWADSFGYYLPVLIVGGYLWRQLREEGGATIDIAVLFLVLYVMLGIAGTSIQIVTLPVLAAAHTGGDDITLRASEMSWRVVVEACVNGLWRMEGPTFAFWGIATGLAMRAQGRKFGLLLCVVGLLYATTFVLGVYGAGQAEQTVQLIMLVALPLWMLLTGVALLREKAG